MSKQSSKSWLDSAFLGYFAAGSGLLSDKFFA
jgi:hypothetical protein